ncbi:hypothetical protein [Phytohabitans rumicis]|uniref:Uncharacterized protein n=1 Tax=Phytohabitans rumicis TaxID=1076125 RepID=A0A6V8LEF4_9ACTN|nr:hypothetical protein [Phytohabitans rumicis]GFJ92466.1 hypothetical protein Prum_061080 [Phytohabitans rumicis]
MGEERELTAAELVEELVINAWAIYNDHAPVDGQCPVCKVPTLCEARAGSIKYLRSKALID